MPSINQAAGGCSCAPAGHTLCGCTNVPDTITATANWAGSATLTWDGVDRWSGTSTLNYTCSTCTPKTVTLYWEVLEDTGVSDCNINIGWFFDTGPVCARDTGANFSFDNFGSGDFYGNSASINCGGHSVTFTGGTWPGSAQSPWCLAFGDPYEGSISW